MSHRLFLHVSVPLVSICWLAFCCRFCVDLS